MAFKDRFRRKALTGSPAVVQALNERSWSPYPLLGGGSRQRIKEVYSTAQSANYLWMYTNSPAVRTNVDLIARNMGQLDLRLFEEVKQDDRQPRPDHPAAMSLRYPNPTTPGDQFIRQMFTDFLVYWNAYALVAPAGRRLSLWWLPAHRMELGGQSIFDAEWYRYHNPHNGTHTDFAPEQILHWRGENAHDQRLGLSPLETLRNVVGEDAALVQANVELAKSGLTEPVWAYRPLDAPVMTPETRQRVEEDLHNRLKRVNDTPPFMEEGTELRGFGVSPHDAQMLDIRQWLLYQVATVYGNPGPLVGLEGDLEKARSSFYTDTLPPYAEAFTRMLNNHILVREFSETEFYFEFDLDEKLMGDERMKTFIAMAGGPIATRNESRAKIDLPPLPGGDELLTPTNYGVGAKPKPTTTVMPVQDPNRPSQDGDARSTDLPTPQPARDKAAVKAEAIPGFYDTEVKIEPAQKELEVTNVPRLKGDMDRQSKNIAKARKVFEGHYRQQRAVLMSKREGKSQNTRPVKPELRAANSEEWNRRLAEKIERVASGIVENEAGIYTARLGGDDFDMGLVEAYLAAQALGTAEGVNEATQRDINELGVEKALERAQNERAETAARSIGVRATTFAREEAAKQSPFPESRLKTWIPHTARHASLGGVSVPLNSSWGGLEPGSAPNCRCSCSIT